MSTKILGSLCLLVVGPMLQADGLTDLRAALLRFPARESVRAAVSIETQNRSDDEDDKPDSGKTSFEAEHGARGLQVTYAPETIARAQQEGRANASDPEKPTPTRTAMRQIDVEDLIASLDAAGAIARMLDTAKLTRDQRISSGGKPLRQLTLTLHPKMSKADAKRVKTFEMSLVVNLDADGTPVSAEMKQNIKIKFLLLSFQQEQKESWVFARTADRLVALRHAEHSNGSGMGQKFENSKVTTLALR